MTARAVVDVVLARARGRFGRDLGAMLLHKLGKVLLQAGYFVVVARMLGVRDFGLFAGTVALAAIVAPFVSGGTMQLIVRNVAQRHRPVAEQYATSLVVTTAGGLATTCVVVAAGSVLAPRGLGSWELCLLLLADLVLVRLIECTDAAFQSVHRMLGTAACTWALHGARLAAAVATFLLLPRTSLTSWTWIYTGTTAAATLVVLALGLLAFGPARPEVRSYLREAHLGLQFSVSQASQTAYNDLDKAMLARLSTSASVGLYSAAYRVVDVAFTPIRSVLGAAWPRFFRLGADGLHRTWPLARRLLVPCLAYAVVVSAGLLLCAGLLPVLLGADFADAVGALRGLAVIPVLRVVQLLVADALTGAGYHGRRTVVQIAVAVANFALNLVVLPIYSWRGAVVTSVLCDLVLVVALVLVARGTLRRESRATAPAAPSMVEV